MKVAATPAPAARARPAASIGSEMSTPTSAAVVPSRRDGHRRASRPAANVEQPIGTTRGRQVGEPIGERLEQLVEHRLGLKPRVTRRAVPALSLFFGGIHQLSSM